MDTLFEILNAASFGVATMAIAVLGGGLFYVFHVIPKLKELDELKEAEAEWESKLNALRTELDKALITIKDHVESDVTGQQLGELLKTCQMTQHILAEHVKKTDLDVRKLADELDNAYEYIRDIKRLCESDPASGKINSLDSEMRIISQQIASITNRLHSITGLLIGTSPTSRAMSDLLGGEVKELK